MQHASNDFPVRKNIRLNHWDYSNAGCYHVTACTVGRAMLFGAVVSDGDGRARVELTQLGHACEGAIADVNVRFPSVAIANHVVMPNHVHVLVSLQGDDVPKLGRVVRYFKSQVTNAARRRDPDAVIWQRSYHDRIIRDERGFLSVWEYIDENPLKWQDDRYYRQQ